MGPAASKPMQVTYRGHALRLVLFIKNIFKEMNGPSRKFVSLRTNERTQVTFSNRRSMPHLSNLKLDCKGTVIATRPWARMIFVRMMFI